jgi:hypothetical protein
MRYCALLCFHLALTTLYALQLADQLQTPLTDNRRLVLTNC